MVVATDAVLTKAECGVLAGVAHDGVARGVRPAHTLFDGDCVFALATGHRPLELESTDAYAAGPSRAALVNDLAVGRGRGRVPGHRARRPVRHHRRHLARLP